jgi:hypothetical protein
VNEAGRLPVAVGWIPALCFRKREEAGRKGATSFTALVDFEYRLNGNEDIRTSLLAQTQKDMPRKAWHVLKAKLLFVKSAETLEAGANAHRACALTGQACAQGSKLGG